MPILPLDHPEPFAATLGLMLYPATDESDPPKARAYAAQLLLADPIRRYLDAGHRLSQDTFERIAMDAGYPVTDFTERWDGGLATGDLLKALYLLARDHPALASWGSAIKIYEESAKRRGVRGSRTSLLQQRDRFLSVAHLWAAWSFREGKFVTHPEVGYNGYADFQSFLAEAEFLRDFGHNWRPARSTGKPLLPPDVWRVPEGWEPLTQEPGWPRPGRLFHQTVLPEDLLAFLRPAGRPRKGA
jgi:hypothetical protein